ncbi:MAG TPA: efflux RND transporter periplasmic adaptor subunit [Cytophagaceae bacterium]|nr:efflux RND transporter periplasmic adaptor subunit [Cytophagaceae bacterium]
MSKLKIPLLIIAVIAVLALIKIFFLMPKKQEGSGGPGGKPMTSPVTGYIVKAETVDNDVASSGTISANEDAELHPEVSGKIASLNFVEGGRISKGTLIVKINDADLQAQLRKLNSQLSLAQEKQDRLKKLFDINGVSQEEYDIAANDVINIKADIDNMMAQIAKTEIRAPFDGVLGLKKVSMGAYVTPSTIITTMQQLDPIKVDFSVPEKYMDKIRKGDKALFTVQGLDGTFSANIYAIDPKIDLATRTIQLRALAPNHDGKIFPGAFARVQLVLAQNKSAIMVPTESIVPILKGQKVYLYKNGKAEERKVETGIRTPTKIEIVKGLEMGDTVVVTGVMSIKQDSQLKLLKVQ